MLSNGGAGVEQVRQLSVIASTINPSIAACCDVRPQTIVAAGTSRLEVALVAFDFIMATALRSCPPDRAAKA